MSDLDHDDYFDDPSANIIFKSSSGKCYRISSWCLAKQSSFFAGLQGSNLSPAVEPIETDLDDSTPKEMLVRINSGLPVYDNQWFTLYPLPKHIFPLYTFFDKHSFDRAAAALKLRLEDIFRSDPWKFLIEASDCACLDLALVAIGNSSSREVTNRHFWYNIAKLGGDWRGVLIMGMTATEEPPSFKASSRTRGHIRTGHAELVHLGDKLASRFQHFVSKSTLPDEEHENVAEEDAYDGWD